MAGDAGRDDKSGWTAEGGGEGPGSVGEGPESEGQGDEGGDGRVMVGADDVVRF